MFLYILTGTIWKHAMRARLTDRNVGKMKARITRWTGYVGAWHWQFFSSLYSAIAYFRLNPFVYELCLNIKIKTAVKFLFLLKNRKYICNKWILPLRSHHMACECKNSLCLCMGGEVYKIQNHQLKTEKTVDIKKTFKMYMYLHTRFEKKKCISLKIRN